jgi:hypothetical protein
VVAHALRAVTELGRTHYHAAAERLTALWARLEPWHATTVVQGLEEALN